MADPLTIVGGIAAVIQIAEALTYLTSELRSCIRTVRYAPQEVQQFQLDLSNFSASLHMFYKQSNAWLEDLEESPAKETRKEHIAGLIRECRAVEEGFEELLRRFFIRPCHFPNVYGLFDRIRWYFRKRLVAGLKLLLESAKSSVILFVILQMCEDLQKRVEELQRALQKVPKELKRQLRVTKRQLKEQIKVTRDAHKRLIEHVKETPYSDIPLIPDVRSIIGETRAVEQYVTRTLRRESRKVQQRLSTTEQPRNSRSLDLSPDLQLVSRGPRSPQPSSPAHNGLRDSYVRTASLATLERTNSHTISQSASSESINLLNNLETREDQSGAQQATLFSTSSLPKASSVSSQPSQVTGPKTVGPIIHDDGKEIRESYGAWRVDAVEESLPSTDSNRSVANMPAPLTRQVRPPRPIGSFSDSSERNDSVETMAEPTGNDQQTPKVGSSPYKAVPPFVNDDWKGIRRRPST